MCALLSPKLCAALSVRKAIASKLRLSVAVWSHTKFGKNKINWNTHSSHTTDLVHNPTEWQSAGFSKPKRKQIKFKKAICIGIGIGTGHWPAFGTTESVIFIRQMFIGRVFTLISLLIDRPQVPLARGDHYKPPRRHRHLPTSRRQRITAGDYAEQCAGNPLCNLTIHFSNNFSKSEANSPTTNPQSVRWSIALFRAHQPPPFGKNNKKKKKMKFSPSGLTPNCVLSFGGVRSGAM